MSSCNSARPAGAPARATAIDPWRYFTKDFKRTKCGTKTQRGGHGLPYTNEDGSQGNFRCPKCGAVIGIERDLQLTNDFLKCGCGWKSTEDELREIRQRDPENIVNGCYTAYTRVKPSWRPRFEQPNKRSGAEMRDKRFLSKCIY